MKVVCFDLDDTLCKEIDFLMSAYKEIASNAVQVCVDNASLWYDMAQKASEAMLEAYYLGHNAFEALNTYLGTDIPLDEMLKMYREHVPSISLSDDVIQTLDRLKTDGILMGIVSDGRELTQWNKIRALGLTEWIPENNIIINSSVECFKPAPSGYERLIKAVQSSSEDSEWEFTYVGDNLKKDFIYPNKHGWKTICLKNDGRNIHSQNFDDTPVDSLPDRVVESMREI